MTSQPASICRDGRLPSLVNRKLPASHPALPLPRRVRQQIRAVNAGRGLVDPAIGMLTWGKHCGNGRKTRRQRVRNAQAAYLQFEETGRL